MTWTGSARAGRWTTASSRCGPRRARASGACASTGSRSSGSFMHNCGASSSQGGRQRQGSIQWVGDPIGHYPGWVAISRTHAEMLVSAGAPAGVFLLRPTRAGEPQGWTSAQSAGVAGRAQVWHSGTTPGGPLRPSFWPVAGARGLGVHRPAPRRVDHDDRAPRGSGQRGHARVAPGRGAGDDAAAGDHARTTRTTSGNTSASRMIERCTTAWRCPRGRPIAPPDRAADRAAGRDAARRGGDGAHGDDRARGPHRMSPAWVGLVVLAILAIAGYVAAIILWRRSSLMNLMTWWRETDDRQDVRRCTWRSRARSIRAGERASTAQRAASRLDAEWRETNRCARCAAGRVDHVA